MASASQKRPAATDEYHEDDAKRPRAEEPTLHVYEPCVLLPVGQRIGSLVEVRSRLRSLRRLRMARRLCGYVPSSAAFAARRFCCRRAISSATARR